MTPEAHAAHHVAKSLATIHLNLSALSPDTRKTLAIAFGGTETSFENALVLMAQTLERQHPFTPVSEAQRAQLVEELADCVSDLTRHEIAAEMLNADNNTEAEWRMLADEKIDNLRFDAEHEEDADVRAEYLQQIADFEALGE